MFGLPNGFVTCRVDDGYANLSRPLLYFSHYLERSRGEYDEHPQAIRLLGKSTQHSSNQTLAQE
jgi:hypothetical protein